MLELEFRHYGERPLIPISILPPFAHDLRSVDAVGLVDTGATTGAITGELATALGLPVRGKRAMAFGNADMQVERYLFRIGVSTGSDGPAFPFIFPAIEGFRLRSAFTFTAILGMDILSRCDLLLERSGRCTLRFGP